jgi:uncharacterized protein (TIGR02598 family)
MKKIFPKIFTRRRGNAEARRGLHPSGFTLVEVTLALGVASFCLLAVFGLMPVGISSNRASVEQTAAASLARAIVADLRTTPIAAASSPQYAIPFPSASAPLYFAEDGTKQTGHASARYLATITINTAAQTAFANIKITWPAAAPVASAAGSYEVATAIGR